jgi:hypothetical protein
MPSDLPCWLLASTAARLANDKYGAKIAVLGRETALAEAAS